MSDMDMIAVADGGSTSPASAYAEIGDIPTGLLHIIRDVEDSALSIASYLSAKDLLALGSVNSTCRNLISSHSNELFEYLLRTDFTEGHILAYIAKERKISYKKLYLAFQHRFSLQKQVVEDGERIRIPWRRPVEIETKDESDEDYEFPEDSCDEENENGDEEDEDEDEEEDRQENKKIPLRPASKNNDVGSLMFIARVGNSSDPGTCALMDWEYYGTECTEMGKKLVIDHHRNKATGGGGFYLPTAYSPARDSDEVVKILENAHKGSNWFEEVKQALKESDSYHITLHVVDVKEYKVISLMDDTPFGKYGGPDFSDAKFDIMIHGYGYDLPNLYGVPLRESPYYRSFMDRDFPSSGYDEAARGIDIFEVTGSLYIGFNYVYKEEEADADDRIFCPKNMGIQMFPQEIDFHFHRYGRSVIRICSFLRALMKEKCAVVGPLMLGDEAPLVVSQQPCWVETEEILDKVISFTSFEDQAGKLRLVCRQFEVSALKQLKRKLDETKVISFNTDYEFGESWFKVTATRGWSSDCLTSEESVVDDALWFLSCRCSFRKCQVGEDCPSANKPTQCSVDGVTKTLDMDDARSKLAKTGRLRLSEPTEWDMRSDYYVPDGAECSFERKEMSVFEVCSKVDGIISDQLAPELLFVGEEVMLNQYLKRDYRVSGNITSSQFIRSIFLVFAKASYNTANNNVESGSVGKKARVAPIKEVTVGMAKANICVENGGYSRMKKIFRFFSAANEPMEICIESKSSSEC